MPKFKILEASEVERVRALRPGSSIDRTPYMEIIRAAKAGQMVVVEPDLDAGEDRRVTKRRLTESAKDLKVTIKYLDLDDEEYKNKVVFEVLDPKHLHLELAPSTEKRSIVNGATEESGLEPESERRNAQVGAKNG